MLIVNPPNSAITVNERGSRGQETRFQWSRDEENPEGVVHLTERATWADQKKAVNASVRSPPHYRRFQEKLTKSHPDVYAAVKNQLN